MRAEDLFKAHENMCKRIEVRPILFLPQVKTEFPFYFTDISPIYADIWKSTLLPIAWHCTSMSTFCTVDDFGNLVGISIVNIRESIAGSDSRIRDFYA